MNMKILNKINKYFISNYFDKLIISYINGDWGLHKDKFKLINFYLFNKNK